MLEKLDAVIGARAGQARVELWSPRDIESSRDWSPTAGDNTDRANRPHHGAATGSESSPTGSPLSGISTGTTTDRYQVSGAEIAPPPSYTQQLLADRNLRLKKLGEEVAELITACGDGDRERASEEAADVIYHTLVALRATGASLRDVERVLARRHNATPK
jgi:phosphoribosyl-ATP pyrophosphohydrolase